MKAASDTIPESASALDELRVAYERAEAASRTQSRFLASMSHELRTPLNAIIGFSDVLKQELYGPLGAVRYLEYAQLINESGQLLLDLISDILDMSKIEAGRYTLHVEEVDAAGLIGASVRLVQSRIQNHDVALHMTIEREPLLFKADKRAVKQVLLNLLSNAMKFTPAGGAVTIAAKADHARLRISVADTGIGIPEDALPRLGRPFEQVNADQNLSRSGTGLGLALVRSLAGLHGGEMKIESKIGAGTTVTVSFPLSGPAA